MKAVKDRLSQYSQINLTIIGRKSGNALTKPVWFVLEQDKLYLLPVYSSDTQWCKNVLKNRIFSPPSPRGLVPGLAAGKRSSGPWARRASQMRVQE